MGATNKNSIEAFGEYVFDDEQMKKRLPDDVYKDLRHIIEHGGELDKKNADIIAHEMKEWAIEQGCTHYTHWFHPLTGVSAEKHDSFLSPSKDGEFIIKFGGKELI